MKEWTEIPDIDLYTDGGAEPNPGPGGYGIILSYKGTKKEFYEGYKLTTNNRMELMGVIKGLEKLKTKSNVQVYSDSRYVIDGIEKGWAKRWQENHWLRNRKERALNHDLWERLLELVEQHNVTFHWVKGHNSHVENERCDILANKAMHLENLLADEGYENPDLSMVASKIEKEGDLCRKCNTPLVKKENKNHRNKKKRQSYFFEYFLFCESCKTLYMLEEAKRPIDQARNEGLFSDDALK